MNGLAAPAGARAFFFAAAAACFLAASAGLAVRAAEALAIRAAGVAESSLIARVAAPQDAGAITRAVSAVAQAPGVRTAAALDAQHAADLLAQWGGGGLAPEDLADLRLIAIETEPGLEGAQAAWAVEQAGAAVGLTLEVHGAGAASAEAWEAVAAVRRIGGFGLWVAALAAALIVGLIAWGRVGARREAIALAADLGAEEGQVADSYATEAALSGFAAGALGAALAFVGGFGAAIALAPGVPPWDLLRVASPMDLAPLPMTPLAAAAAAALGARIGAAAGYRAAEGRLERAHAPGRRP